MKLLINHFTTAWHSLRINRMRSLLTTIGVAIGVASVTTILSLTFGVTHSIQNQVDELGNAVAVVRPGVQGEQSSSDILRSPLAPQQFSTSTLTETDYDSLLSISEELSVAPIMTVDGALKVDQTRVTNATTLATTDNFIDTAPLEIEEGQFLDESTDDSVAVLGQQLAIDLFGTEMPIGQRFTIRDQTFTVIGVLERQRVPLNYNNTDFNRSAIVSFTAGKNLNQSRSQIQQINIAASSEEQLDKYLPQVDEKLTQAHQDEKDFTIITGDDIAKPTNEVFTTMSLVLIVIAAISLLVGGIGIMNIMLVSVAERTREIGIRKAVGASNATIIIQFLIEALLISLFGGIVGYVVGLACAWVVGSIMYVTPSMSVVVLLIALGVSVGVGVLFGLYPALRASRKDPIESLRQYR